MLDQGIKDQLQSHFAGLSSRLTLSLFSSAHAKQTELRELLQDVTSCSSKITLAECSETVSGVQFDLLREGAPTGVRFRGVPGGHEFTSLVVAILNADGKGKLPDAGIQRRVKALSGPVRLRTYVSLSCTNCPDVVQALNQMALIHPDFRHEMIDGELAESDIRSLGIQGVPAVVSGDAILHVGRANFGELLENLEGRFGRLPAGDVPEQPAQVYDVVVVGGGPAGASAAIYSARKGLRTALVAQRLGGQVQETVGIENLISVPYTEGRRLSADLEKHLRAYSVDLLENRKVEAIRDLGKRKALVLQGGEVLEAAAVIVATGAKWRELGIPGEREYLGRGVAFCPHCEGPFFKGKRVAVIGGGNSGVEAAIDLAGICAHVTLVEYADQLKADEVLVRNLRTLSNAEIITHARTTEVVGNGHAVTELRYQDRPTERVHEIAVDGVFVQIGLVPNSALAKDVVAVNRTGEIIIDERCRTNARGIYAAGDVTTVPFKQIVIAMGEGAKAALAAFEDRMRAA
ncbi:MAG: alkyl hydroperoxide reductase subunit F [Polyangiaceae bacterium]